MSEKENQLNLKSLGKTVPTETFSLKSVHKETPLNVEPQPEEVLISIPSLPQKPVLPKPAQTDFAAPQKQPSFLKSETSQEDIEISLLPKDVIRPARIPHTVQSKYTKWFVYSGVFVVLSLVGVFSWFLFNTGPFYTGSWKGELNEMEKSKGVKELLYTITSDSMTEKLSTDTEGLSVSARVVSRLETTGNNTNIITFKKKDRKIEEITVSIPSILCQKTGTNCDELKTNFEKSFREEIEKQNKTMEGATFKLSTMHSGQIKLESDVEAPRNLIKSK